MMRALLPFISPPDAAFFSPLFLSMFAADIFDARCYFFDADAAAAMYADAFLSLCG